MRRKLMVSHATLALALLAGACSQGESAAQVRTDALQQTTVPTVTVPVDTSAAYALSAAFRSASAQALHAVVYVGVERAATTVQNPNAPMQDIPEPFRRFFQFGDPDQPLEVPPGQGAGSGFILDSDGRVVTNQHVVQGASRIVVRLQDGREFDATLVASDPNTDVALLELDTAEEDLPTVTFGDSDNLRVGDWVLALGNPLGFDFTVTAGIVSAKGRQLDTQNQARLESYIQTDAAINPGNSGGPLVDLTGRVVGMNTAIAGGGSRFVGYGFAVPVNLVKRVLEDLKEYGHVRRPRVGVTVGNVRAVDAEAYGLDKVGGAQIVTVEKGTPGDRAGLRPGDVVLTLDGNQIQNSTDLTTRLAQQHPGDRVTLGVWRDRRNSNVSLTLGEFQMDEAATRPAADREETANLLGFTVEPLTAQIAGRFNYDRQSGVVVNGVSRTSPAAAGIPTGSLILSINGQAVEDSEDVRDIANGLRPGAVVSVRLVHPERGETVYNYRARR